LGGVGFLRTLEVGAGFFYPTPEVQLKHFLHLIPKLAIPVDPIRIRADDAYFVGEIYTL